MRHLTYLGLLAGCLLLTVPLDRAYRAAVFGRPRQLALAIAPGFLLFGGWDLYAIRRGHWHYDLSQMSGVMLPGRLPLEEALFFVVVRYSSKDILGWRLANAPVEDLAFGFALILITLSPWVRLTGDRTGRGRTDSR